MVQGMGPEERMSHTGPGRVGFRLSGLLCSLLLVTVVACKKKPIVEEVVEEISIYPELGCLEGTKAVGTPPPMGTEVWCATTQEGNSYRNGAAIEWYNNEHCAQLLRFNGAVSARRYRAILGEDKYQYMAVYEFKDEAAFERFQRSEEFAELLKDYDRHWEGVSERHRAGYVQVFP